MIGSKMRGGEGRSSPVEIQRQYGMLSEIPYVRQLLDAFPDMAVILNKHRQIVLSNQAFIEFAGRMAAGGDETLLLDDLLGRRPGESICCVRSDLTESGCGTSEFCRFCGAGQAMVSSLQSRSPAVRECRLVCADGSDEHSIDLRVWSRPLDVNGEVYLIFSVVDVSDQKRRIALERIFFHDVLNTAGGVKGLAELLSNADKPDPETRELSGLISESASHLVDEIIAQRILSAAERSDLLVSPERIRTRELLQQVARHFRMQSEAQGTAIRIDPGSEDAAVVADPVLLRRVLGNLVKNALEAAGGDLHPVTLAVRCTETDVQFSVQNAEVMENDVRMQLFTRSFSTKGRGRGLGTYSVKLLTERYLGGRVSVVSEPGSGTCFTVSIPRDRSQNREGGGDGNR